MFIRKILSKLGIPIPDNPTQAQKNVEVAQKLERFGFKVALYEEASTPESIKNRPKIQVKEKTAK